MSRLKWLILAIACLATGAESVQGRTWTDSTGKYSIEATLVTFNDKLVVLKKENHELAAVPLDKLSKADQDYVQSQEVQDAMKKAANQYPTWTFRNGMQIVGRVEEYGRKDVVIQRRRDRIYVNDRLYDNLPEIYQKMVLRIVNHFENIPIDNKTDLYNWAVKQKGDARTFTCDGVKLELENGDIYGIPFFLFTDDDMQILKPGWDKWLAAENHAEQRSQQQFMLESEAQAYQQDRQVSHQIAMFNALSDWFDLWEVQLIPKQGVGGGLQSTIIPATNSAQAAAAAAAQNPNYTVGAMRTIPRSISG